MGTQTAIAWTDHTFNPWWGCSRVSPGCNHCYAETFAKRTGHAVWGKDGARRFFGDKHWAEPLKWNRDAAGAVPGVRGPGRHLVFCASMADVFEDHQGLMFERVRLWDLIADTPHLDWQLLTKRPQNVRRMVPGDWLNGAWPANVWIGTTAEDQQRADERIPALLELPAPVRFLSCEPLLDYVALGKWCAQVPDRLRWNDGGGWIAESEPRPTIDWVICGGESGPGHRPLDLAHARRLLLNCQYFGIPFFFKQVGGRTPTAGGDALDGCVWKQFPELVVAR